MLLKGTGLATSEIELFIHRTRTFCAVPMTSFRLIPWTGFHKEHQKVFRRKIQLFPSLIQQQLELCCFFGP